MPALEDPRREQFAQLIASGKEAKESYTYAGYTGKGAGQSAARLTKDPKVSARIAELRELAQQIPLASSWLNENFVLQGLKDAFQQALADKKYGDAIAALNLMGKKLGLWLDRVDHNLKWDGDPGSLNEVQMRNLAKSLMVMAYGDDGERMRQEQIKTLEKSGLLIEGQVPILLGVQPEPSQAPTPAEPQSPKSWVELDPESRRLLAAEWGAREDAPKMPVGLPKEERVRWLNDNWPVEGEGW